MVEVKPEDLEFLKDELWDARKQQHSASFRKDMSDSRMVWGISRGLEMALVRMGVLNSEMDKINHDAYRKAEEEWNRSRGED